MKTSGSFGFAVGNGENGNNYENRRAEGEWKIGLDAVITSRIMLFLPLADVAGLYLFTARPLCRGSG